MQNYLGAKSEVTRWCSGRRKNEKRLAVCPLLPEGGGRRKANRCGLSLERDRKIFPANESRDRLRGRKEHSPKVNFAEFKTTISR